MLFAVLSRQSSLCLDTSFDQTSDPVQHIHEHYNGNEQEGNEGPKNSPSALVGHGIEFRHWVEIWVRSGRSFESDPKNSRSGYKSCRTVCKDDWIDRL
jgi:hypothetical protein